MSFCREGGILPSSPTTKLDFCFRINPSWHAWAASRYGHFHPCALFISRISAGQADQEDWAGICFLQTVPMMSVIQGQPHKMSSLHITSVLPAATEPLEFLFLAQCRFFGNFHSEKMPLLGAQPLLVPASHSWCSGTCHSSPQWNEGEALETGHSKPFIQTL